MAITDISDWTKNDASLFLTFENIFFDTTNELTYKGSSGGYERIYFPIPSEPGQTVTFTVKFCSPSGFSCSYGDSKDYIALASDLPSSTQQLSSLPILAKTPLDSAASNTLREYVVTAIANTTTTYCVIDFGYMLDNVTVSLKYVDISVTAEYKWKIQDGELTNTEFIPLPERPFVGDSPYTMWRIDPDINNGMPFSPLMIGLPTLAHTGAFMDCENLSYAEIPHSCKAIGRFTFAGTALRKVKIASDCTYHDTSFPEGCEVEFYGGGGQWGQLLDGDGYAVVDGDGARIYIEEEN